MAEARVQYNINNTARNQQNPKCLFDSHVKSDSFGKDRQSTCRNGSIPLFAFLADGFSAETSRAEARKDIFGSILSGVARHQKGFESGLL